MYQPSISIFVLFCEHASGDDSHRHRCDDVTRGVAKHLLAFARVFCSNGRRNKAAFRNDTGLCGRGAWFGGVAGRAIVIRVDHVDFGHRHELDVASQVTLLDRDHLAAIILTALAFAFYVARVFVGLTAAGLPRLDLGVGGGNSGNRQ